MIERSERSSTPEAKLEMAELEAVVEDEAARLVFATRRPAARHRRLWCETAGGSAMLRSGDNELEVPMVKCPRGHVAEPYELLRPRLARFSGGRALPLHPAARGQHGGRHLSRAVRDRTPRPVDERGGGAAGSGDRGLYDGVRETGDTAAVGQSSGQQPRRCAVHRFWHVRARLLRLRSGWRHRFRVLCRSSADTHLRHRGRSVGVTDVGAVDGTGGGRGDARRPDWPCRRAGATARWRLGRPSGRLSRGSSFPQPCRESSPD